jgi:hypothetical protein
LGVFWLCSLSKFNKERGRRRERERARSGRVLAKSEKEKKEEDRDIRSRAREQDRERVQRGGERHLRRAERVLRPRQPRRAGGGNAPGDPPPPPVQGSPACGRCANSQLRSPQPVLFLIRVARPAVRAPLEKSNLSQ